MYIFLGLFSWMVLGEVLVVVIFGGFGMFVGLVIGVVVFVVLKYELSLVMIYWYFVVGVILIVVVMSCVNGIFGWIEVCWGGVFDCCFVDVICKQEFEEVLIDV